jgi:hypothetical protein
VKGAVIVPVPKSSCPKTLSDFRPVALTFILMKTFEKMVRTEGKLSVCLTPCHLHIGQTGE